MKKEKRVWIGFSLGLLILGGVLFWSSGARSGDIYETIENHIFLIGKVYNELIQKYVNKVDSEEIVESAINGMLSTLDPYTNYIKQEDKAQLEILTEGKYQGVGLILNYRNNKVVVGEPPFMGTPAARAGIREGDVIVKVNNMETSDLGFEKTVQNIRGPAGTEVVLTIQREGEPKPLEFRLIREQIKIEDVQYAGFVDDGIGYILLTRFSKNAGPEVKNAIRKLQAQKPLKGLILDLRSNPGGMLESAVEVAELFLPKNSLIVSTRGRLKETVQEFRSQNPPVYGEGPLVILVNGISASASEIVAGAIQDHDRGIIVGDTTFGKGLVQTVVPLSSNSALKITTAKYYTPSGRCIQRKNYSKWQDSTAIHPETRFRTDQGRSVSEGGGIIPDYVIRPTEPSDYYWDLRRKSMFFNFAVFYANTHAVLDSNVEVTDAIISEFQKYLKEKSYEYQHPIEKGLEGLKNEAIQNGYGTELLKDIDKVQKSLQRAEQDMFYNCLGDIKRTLRLELASKFFGTRKQIELALKDDVVFQKALELFRDPELYKNVLHQKN